MFDLLQSGLIGVWSARQARLLAAKQAGTGVEDINLDADERLLFAPDGMGRLELYQPHLTHYETFRWEVTEGLLRIVAGVAFIPQYGLVEGVGFHLMDIFNEPSSFNFPQLPYTITEEPLAAGTTLGVVTFGEPIVAQASYGRYRFKLDNYPEPAFPEDL
jgi:hypothetical protein